jgi:hypothetical protein
MNDNHQHNLNIHSRFDLGVWLQTPIPCELYIDVVDVTTVDCKKILWVIEPDEVSHIKEIILNNYKKFDVILTWDDQILEQCDNAILYPFGSSWISNFDTENNKDFIITTLIGGKQQLEGHQLRHDIPKIISKVKIPIHIFNSINNPNGSHIENARVMESRGNKNELFYGQYHICIENTKKNNWFTEKLIDCFQTKTIPIYYGPDNIEKFFDVRGMFLINNLEELENVCNGLSEETYSEKKEFIEKNFLLSNSYSNAQERIKYDILNYCENQNYFKQISFYQK